MALRLYAGRTMFVRDIEQGFTLTLALSLEGEGKRNNVHNESGHVNGQVVISSMVFQESPHSYMSTLLPFSVAQVCNLRKSGAVVVRRSRHVR